MLKNYKNMPKYYYEKNDKKWQKMTQEMIVNETGDWNILERTEKKSKGL